MGDFHHLNIFVQTAMSKLSLSKTSKRNSVEMDCIPSNQEQYLKECMKEDEDEMVNFNLKTTDVKDSATTSDDTEKSNHDFAEIISTAIRRIKTQTTGSSESS